MSRTAWAAREIIILAELHNHKQGINKKSLRDRIDMNIHTLTTELRALVKRKLIISKQIGRDWKYWHPEYKIEANIEYNQHRANAIKNEKERSNKKNKANYRKRKLKQDPKWNNHYKKEIGLGKRTYIKIGSARYKKPAQDSNRKILGFFLSCFKGQYPERSF